MRSLLLPSLVLCMLLPFALGLRQKRSAGEEAASHRSGYPRVEIPDTERRVLRSQYVDEEFKIHVAVPRDYFESEERYPVIYLLDSEYSFGCVAYVVRRLNKGGLMPKVIVVGISYEVSYEEYYRRRERDYTPTRAHLEDFPLAGHGADFLRFIERELIPFVDSNYRVKAQDRTLIGYSFSGLFGAYALFNRPELFQRYVLVSPSLWWQDGVCFRYERDYAEGHRELPARLFVTSGDREGYAILANVRELERVLEKRNYRKLEYQVRILEDETHRSIFPNAVTRGLRYVFRDGAADEL